VRYSGNKVLVPYNFTTASDYALELAIDVAQALQTDITLFHVAEVANYRNFNKTISKTYVGELISFLENEIEKTIEKLAPSEMMIDHKIGMGKAAQEIVELTKQGAYGLVIMGYQKSLLPKNLVLGSNVDRVIRFTNIPVLTIREPFASSDMGDIVFATDLVSAPTYLVSQLSKLQVAMEANLHIVKINTKENWISSKEAETQMDYFRKVHHLSNYDFSTYDDLTPEQGILNYANHIHAGVIAMGIHNLSQVDTLVHQHHIAEDVVKSAHQLIWTCTI